MHFLKLKFRKGHFFFFKPSFPLIKSVVNFLLLFSKDRIRLTLNTSSDHTLPFWNTAHSCRCKYIYDLICKTLGRPYVSELTVSAISQFPQASLLLSSAEKKSFKLLTHYQQSSRRISSLERCLSKWHCHCR